MENKLRIQTRDYMTLPTAKGSISRIIMYCLMLIVCLVIKPASQTDALPLVIKSLAIGCGVAIAIELIWTYMLKANVINQEEIVYKVNENEASMLLSNYILSRLSYGALEFCAFVMVNIALSFGSVGLVELTTERAWDIITLALVLFVPFEFIPVAIKYFSRNKETNTIYCSDKFILGVASVALAICFIILFVLAAME